MFTSNFHFHSIKCFVNFLHTRRPVNIFQVSIIWFYLQLKVTARYGYLRRHNQISVASVSRWLQSFWIDWEDISQSAIMQDGHGLMIQLSVFSCLINDVNRVFYWFHYLIAQFLRMIILWVNIVYSTRSLLVSGVQVSRENCHDTIIGLYFLNQSQHF